MAELSAVPFDKLPPTGDGYTVLYDNDQVCRSDKKLSELVGARTSSFLTKEEGDSLYQEKGDYLVEDDITGKLDKEQYANDSATFLTAHQSLDEYATMEWVENQNYITGVDLTNYYTKSETSGANEISAALEEKQDKLTFAGTSNTITSINNSAIAGGGTGASNSWKQLSEDNHSSGEVTEGKFCVYIGKYNSGFNDSYTMGRENYSERGVNIGYANKIDVNTEEILPGNVNIGKWNLVDGAGGINIGQSNSAKYFGINIGETSTAYSGGYNFGSTNSAFINSVSIGKGNIADNASQSIGFYNKASYNSFSIGYGNTTRGCGYTYGQGNSAESVGIAMGQGNSAKDGSVAIGIANSAKAGSFCIGKAINADTGSLAMGESIRASYGAIAYGINVTATSGSVSIGDNNTSLIGSTVIGNNNNAPKADQVFGIGNMAYTGSTIIGFNNNAGFATVIGNVNAINQSGLNNPEIYTKQISQYLPTENIQIKSFVAGIGNTAYYAKNAYILGHYNKITCESSADYLNPNNDGFTFIYGMRNSADRNWDMAIGYKTCASGGENIAIGVPFNSIVAAYTDGNAYTANINPVAHGYKNFVLRGNVSGISNTAINSNLTGNYVTDSDINASVNNSLINSFVQANTIRDVESYGSTYPVTGSLINNTFKNSNVLLTAYNVYYNKFMNDYGVFVTSNNGFNFNNFWHNKTIELSGENINKNIILNNERLHIESPDICRNFIMNLLPDVSTAKNNFTATKLFTDNFIVKTIIASSNNTLSSVNENFIFNTRIDPSNVTAYRGWDESNDKDTTLSRNFLVGSYVGKYVYGTVSFADNSDRNTETGKISNTNRIFNFGDNTINKSENSFIFGDENKTSAISRTFVFGKRNNINKTKLTNNIQDYVTDIFVFGYENNVIADNDDLTYPILERNRIFGIHNLIKSSEHLNDNLIVGNCNSISYNTTKPTKNTIRKNVNFPSTPYSSESAAFATYRNNILGNGNRVSQCITDSLIVGAGNYVFDTTEHLPNMTADYNSIYTLGVGNVAYDGSNQLNIGYNNETSGHFAEAIGDGIVAKGQQLIIGKCNSGVDGTNRYSLTYNNATSSVETVEPSGVIFAIGNGTYDYTTGSYTDSWGYTQTGYLDKNNNVIPSADINNELYITRSNAMIVSANGVVSASDYCTSAGDKLSDLTEIITLLHNKPTTGTYIIKCIDGTLTWVAET